MAPVKEPRTWPKSSDSSSVAGSAAAFQDLAARYYRPVAAFLLRRVGRPDVVEDLVQETFLEAFRSLREGRGPDTFSSWLFGIASNLAGKWLRRNPPILVVEEPTKGVDIRAKRDIHDQLVAHARAGAAILVASSDLPEILELADRIVVLDRGRVAGILSGATATEEAVMSLASDSTAGRA